MSKANRFRFRLWSKRENRMLPALQHPSLCMNGELYASGMNVTEHYVMMFSTGLQDSCGVEIFEGDVLRYEGDEYPCFVAWVDRDAQFATFDCADPTEQLDTMAAYGGCGWVIGNTHENPELLEAATA